MQLANSDIKHPAVGWNATPEEVVWSLVQCRLYDTAFSLLFLFWKDSSQKRFVLGLHHFDFELCHVVVV
jgi:hypothetical protein